ncbi:MAG TPA: hypothetical protein VNQ77_18815 [Frankiaceae bacterium]|nr:hypothetical protein [Frankiaceae bacterium]
MLVAHPLTGSPPLPVPPLLLAAVAVFLAAVLVTRVRASGGAAVVARTEPAWLWVPRLLSALVLLLLVVVARVGPVDEPDNLAAVAVVHLVWPLLLVSAVLVGPLVWRAVDPWWALGAAERLAAPPGNPPGDTRGDPPGGPGPPAEAHAGPSVWPAVALGAGWALFLGWYAVSVPPRTLGIALAAYTLVLVAGAVALGRARWLARADAVGLVVTWTGLLRRGLIWWTPPAGAAVLLGAVFGGVAFARLRLGATWGRVALSESAALWNRGGAVAAVVAGGALAYAAERWAVRRGAAGSVAVALVPMVAATAVATVLRRAMVAAQLVPRLATDPFDRGWRLLGPLGDGQAVDVNPWGTAVQQALAYAVLLLGALAAAWVVARRVRGVRARDPAAYTVYLTTFAAVVVATTR